MKEYKMRRYPYNPDGNIKENIDPRKIPMGHMGIAELWSHLQECKEWDRKEKEAGLEKFNKKDFEL